MSDEPHRVLIVDDDVDICQNMNDILQEFGYRTDMAHDGASAMKLVNSTRYDVALLDFKMPDTDGAALYTEIKKVQPSLIAIMVTAYAGSDGVQRAKDAGTWHVLRKPVDFEQLLSLIDEGAKQPIVLVVDDDAEFCDTLWSILRDQDVRVAIANDVDGAIEVLADIQADVVLLDMNLGDSLCTPVFEKLVLMEPMPSTCLISGDHEKKGLADDMVSRGAVGISLKPLDMDSLLTKIKSLISSDS